MRFRQLDSIVDLQSGKSIKAVRSATEHEGYFADHFPEYPVVPGVLTLEGMIQACDWLIREADDFSKSMVLCTEVRNAKFTGLVRPSQEVLVSATLKKSDARRASFTAEATVDDFHVASAKIVLERFDLVDRDTRLSTTDAYLRKKKREQFEILQPDSPSHVLGPPTCFRWMWIDRYSQFVSGRDAKSIKTVSMTDEPIDMYNPGYPIMPCSLIIEGIAQTGGTLVGERSGFKERVVLAKISKAIFHREAVPGDKMVFTTEIADLQPEGAMVHGTSHIDGEIHAEVELFFGYLSDHIVVGEMIRPADLVRILRMMRLYEVAENEDGQPLAVPQRLADAEREALGLVGPARSS